MPELSGRMKFSFFGAIALWVLARSVFAMDVAKDASGHGGTHSQQGGVDGSSLIYRN